ncbi:hypothetical protein N7448_011340 [Penicillium atrosanguineum]|nr:hypothetical protein N7448_011340 [Penicillium atrosanguineum]
MGTRLHNILDLYLHRLQTANTTDGEDRTFYCPSDYVKPMNIIVITDDMFNGDVEIVITDFAKSLHELPISTIPSKVETMTALANNLLEQIGSSPGEHCSHGTVARGRRPILSADGIFKCVLGAAHKRLIKESSLLARQSRDDCPSLFAL